jgi:hypothetical protein
MVVVVLLVVVSYSSVMTMAAAGAERRAFCPSYSGRLSVETHTQTQIGTPSPMSKHADNRLLPVDLPAC